MKACEKRPVAVNKLEQAADDVEVILQEKPEKEISTTEIGAYLMDKLKRLDKVAYVRFASVYRQFKAVGEFMSEVKGLLKSQPLKGRGKK